jgi:hypothetical protein
LLLNHVPYRRDTAPGPSGEAAYVLESVRPSSAKERELAALLQQTQQEDVDSAEHAQSALQQTQQDVESVELAQSALQQTQHDVESVELAQLSDVPPSSAKERKLVSLLQQTKKDVVKYAETEQQSDVHPSSAKECENAALLRQTHKNVVESAEHAQQSNVALPVGADLKDVGPPPAWAAREEDVFPVNTKKIETGSLETESSMKLKTQSSSECEAEEKEKVFKSDYDSAAAGTLPEEVSLQDESVVGLQAASTLKTECLDEPRTQTHSEEIDEVESKKTLKKGSSDEKGKARRSSKGRGKSKGSTKVKKELHSPPHTLWPQNEVGVNVH